MNEWKEYRLNDVIEKFIDYRGKTPNKVSRGIPLITAKVIKDGIILSPDEFIAPDEYSSWMTRGLPKINDVLLTTEAPLGEVALIQDENIALAQRIILLRGNSSFIDNKFLFYSLKTNLMQHRLSARASGSTVQGIKSAELKKILISLPDIDTQQEIVRSLSVLDRKIENLRKQNETLEAIALTLFKHWFVDFEFPNADGKPYKSSGGEMVRSELGKIPAGWRVEKLEEFCKIKHGYAFQGEFITTEETNHILLTPGNFRIGGGFNSSKYKYYSEDTYDEEYVLKTGDLIITMTDLSKEGDTLGFPAFVPRNGNKFFLHNQRIGKVVDSHIDLFFLFFLLCRREYRSHILGSASGSTVRHTSPSRILEYKFAVPSNELLDNFSEVTCNLIDKTFANQEQIQTLTKTRDVLLPKLMSGQLRISP